MFQRFADSFAKKLRESRLWLRPNAHATHAIPEPNFYTTRYVYNVCVVNYGATYNFSIQSVFYALSQGLEDDILESSIDLHGQ